MTLDTAGIHTFIEPMANMQCPVPERLNCQRFFLFCRDTLASRSISKNELLLYWALVARYQKTFTGHYKAQASLIVKEVETRDEAEEQEQEK